MNHNHQQTSEFLKKTLVYVIIVLGLIATLLPFVWMFSTSFKEEGTIMRMPPEWLPEKITFKNYKDLFEQVNFSLHFLNSFIVAAGVTIFGLLINALAGFAFAKYRFPGRERLFVLLLITMMVPGQVTMIPVFILLKYLGFLNSYTGLILPGAASVFGIFLMRQFMMSIPDTLLDSARIDGCSELRIFFQIMLPLCKPAIATLTLFTFMGSWNEFLWALIIMSDEAKYTLPVALANLNGQHNTEWGLLMAGSVAVILPVLVLFLALQKYYIQGIMLSGMKS